MAVGEDHAALRAAHRELHAGVVNDGVGGQTGGHVGDEHGVIRRVNSFVGGDGEAGRGARRAARNDGKRRAVLRSEPACGVKQLAAQGVVAGQGQAGVPGLRGAFCSTGGQRAQRLAGKAGHFGALAVFNAQLQFKVSGQAALIGGDGIQAHGGIGAVGGLVGAHMQRCQRIGGCVRGDLLTVVGYVAFGVGARFIHHGYQRIVALQGCSGQRHIQPFACSERWQGHFTQQARALVEAHGAGLRRAARVAHARRQPHGLARALVDQAQASQRQIHRLSGSTQRLRHGSSHFARAVGHGDLAAMLAVGGLGPGVGFQLGQIDGANADNVHAAYAIGHRFGQLGKSLGNAFPISVAHGNNGPAGGDLGQRFHVFGHAPHAGRAGAVAAVVALVFQVLDELRQHGRRDDLRLMQRNAVAVVHLLISAQHEADGAVMRNDVGVFDRLDDAFHLQVVEVADAAGGVNAHAHVLHAAAARAGHAHAQGVVAFDVFNDFQPAVGHDVNGRITEGQLLIADPERHALRLLLCQRGYALAAQQGVFACVPSLVAVGVDEGDDVKTARVVIAVVGDGG